MRYISRPRRGGKTYEAVQWVKEDPDNRVLICHNEDLAHWTRRNFELTDKQCIGWGRARNGLRGRRVEIGVDDIDMFRNSDYHELLRNYRPWIQLMTETDPFAAIPAIEEVA